MVATAAAVVHLGVLWNGFALDDLTIIVANPLVHSLSGVWRAFAAPYFPANLDVSVYRPLTIATYALCGFANLSSIGIQIGGIGAFENLIHISGGTAVQLVNVHAVGHEAPVIHIFWPFVYCR